MTLTSLVPVAGCRIGHRFELCGGGASNRGWRDLQPASRTVPWDRGLTPPAYGGGTAGPYYSPGTRFNTERSGGTSAKSCRQRQRSTGPMPGKKGVPILDYVALLEQIAADGLEETGHPARINAAQ